MGGERLLSVRGLRRESEDGGNSYTASYSSVIFGDQVTVQVTPKGISFAVRS